MQCRGKKNRAILLAAPWPLFNRPSIQIAALKAYASRNTPHVHVKAHHFFLALADRLGFPLYHAISKRTWLAESVYAAILYPDRRDTIETLFRRQAAGTSLLKSIDFTTLVARVRRTTDRLIDDIRWHTYAVAGFSVSLCQMTASLYLIRRIKTIAPQVFTVVGGSTFSTPWPREILQTFADIDIVVTGEGERPFVRLLQCLKNGRFRFPESGIAGVTSRFSSHAPPERFWQAAKLDDLPLPDFDDYFELLQTLPAARRFFPTLPLEASRGCRWQRKSSAEASQGCAFCNLNLQWDGYRRHSARRTVSDVERLTDRYQTLSIAFMDNMVPLNSRESLFGGLRRLRRDIKLFAETRPDTTYRRLAEMRDAGVRELQIGIESLSTRLLKKMNKGVRVIQNLAIMKNCEELGIINAANLLLWFPGSDARDVEQTLAALPFAMPFRPLKPVRFHLGLESPVWRHYRRFGIRCVRNHPYYQRLFPKEVFTGVHFMIQAYQGDLMKQKKRWRPVEKALEIWRQHYTALRKSPHDDPLLHYRDGGRFIIISQRTTDQEIRRHRLADTSRKIYLFCEAPRRLARIREVFPAFSAEALHRFLKTMVVKRLMFQEEDRYLSLAVAIDRRRRRPTAEEG